MIRRVLLAIDRSGHAGEAVQVTAGLAAALPADVRVAAEGGVARTLGDETREFRAGMLVVGRRGRSPLQRLLLGGVSERLPHVTPCPCWSSRRQTGPPARG